MKDYASRVLPCFALTSHPALAYGATYYLDAPLLPWLWPALEIAAIVIQLVSLRFNSSLWLGCGWLIGQCGAWPDRDITFAIGNSLASLGLLHLYRKKSRP